MFLFLQLWKKFRGEDKAPAHLGSSRDYNVDMMPKVLILSLASLLLLLEVLIFRCCGGSVYDGEWEACSCPYPHRCDQVLVF